MRRYLLALLALTICAPFITLLVKEGAEGSVSKGRYEELFPNHIPFYDYDKFIAGARATAGFCSTGGIADRIRECAAFLAHASHETGGGIHLTEIARHQCPEYCDTSQIGSCAPAAGQAYYGRGWLQISWNYNYCEASKFIYKDDGRTLVENPNILEQDATKATQAALWYWMTQKGPGTKTPHECILSGEGFGCTIRAINGTLECDGSNVAQVRLRIAKYTHFLKVLSGGKVEPWGPNGC